jgi:hypothetical protein
MFSYYILHKQAFYVPNFINLPFICLQRFLKLALALFFHCLFFLRCAVLRLFQANDKRNKIATAYSLCMDEKSSGAYYAGTLCLVAFALLAYKAVFSYLDSSGSIVWAYAVTSGFFGVLGFASIAKPKSKIGRLTGYIFRNTLRREADPEKNQQKQESQET